MGVTPVSSALVESGARHRLCRRATGRPETACAEPARARYLTPLGPATALGGYRAAGTERELLAVSRPDARTLLLDTRAASLSDARVVAHLSADEPSANAALLVDMYLSDPTRGRCRRLERGDLAQPTQGASLSGERIEVAQQPALIDCAGARYAIRPLTLRPDRPELRWTRSRCGNDALLSHLTLRDVVGTLEEYEPARAITTRTVTGPLPESTGVCRLAIELERLLRSPVVLNRRLREAVLRQVKAGESMSEIAIRCGRFKRDRRGRRSGETSWLARRVGQMPEGGQAHPTPWIHSDTLALIARDGLGLSPHEVEL
jgi:hypothetical protein